MGVGGWSARSPGAATCAQGRRSEPQRSRPAGFSRGLSVSCTLGTSGIRLTSPPTLQMADQGVCELRQSPATVLGCIPAPIRPVAGPSVQGKKTPATQLLRPIPLLQSQVCSPLLSYQPSVSKLNLSFRARDGPMRDVNPLPQSWRNALLVLRGMWKSKGCSPGPSRALRPQD